MAFKTLALGCQRLKPKAKTNINFNVIETPKGPPMSPRVDLAISQCPCAADTPRL